MTVTFNIKQLKTPDNGFLITGIKLQNLLGIILYKDRFTKSKSEMINTFWNFAIYKGGEFCYFIK